MAKVAWMALALALAACGGRQSLSDDSGVAFRRVMQAQAQSRPSKALPPISADSAKTMLANREATFRRGGNAPATGLGGDAGMGSFVTGLGGQQTPPSSASFGEPQGTGSYENSAPIRLQAK
jgi:hypothetical protein